MAELGKETITEWEHSSNTLCHMFNKDNTKHFLISINCVWNIILYTAVYANYKVGNLARVDHLFVYCLMAHQHYSSLGY